MSEENGYTTLSEVDSDSASEWCESGSDTDWDDQQGPIRDRKGKAKAAHPVPGAPSVPSAAPPFVQAPPFVPSVAPPSSLVSSQHQVPNDQDKYPDLPDYMPYMPLCVPRGSPRASPGPALLDQPIRLTPDQRNAFNQQQNGSHQHLYPGSSYTLEGFQGAGEPAFTTAKTSHRAGMGLQQGLKNEDQSSNGNRLTTSTSMGLWFDPSVGRIRPQHLPPFKGNGTDFGFEASIPFNPAGPELAMDPSLFAPFGVREPPVETEHNSSEPKASSNGNAITIPLLCFLCEKMPKFSDVSHLLTHISSKGHLSRRFHLDLKAQTDKDVQQRLLKFDLWFEQHGIQQLLKTRQEAKDQKKQTQVKRQRGAGNEKSRRTYSAREGLAIEPKDILHMPGGHSNPLNQKNWHQDAPFDNSYQTPSNKQTRSVYPAPGSPQNLFRQTDEPNETGGQGGSRTPTLKGVIHDGMGIFDAGTPEMKRTRNQKKHPSVLNNMLLVSKSISMTEQVWNGSMTKIEHERNVYDNPTDLSSPGSKDDEDDEDDEPMPHKSRGPHAAPQPTGPTSKRLTRSATRAMNGASIQVSRGGKRGGGKRGGAKRGGLKRGGGKKIPKIEDEDLDSEEELHIRPGKRSLSVFHDAAADDGPRGGDVFGGPPQGARGFGASSFGDQQAIFSHRTAMQGLPSNRHMSSMYGHPANHHFEMHDKENDRNVFSMQQPPNMHGYYQNMQSGVFNPLCVQRQDSFPNFYGQGFDTFKPDNSAFQFMDGMGFSGMHGGMNNELSSGLNNGLNNDLRNGLNSDMSHGLTNGFRNNGTNNGTGNGSQLQPGNNVFDIQ